MVNRVNVTLPFLPLLEKKKKSLRYNIQMEHTNLDWILVLKKAIKNVLGLMEKSN